ncbi:hypothetical protein CLOM_g9699 [Closterium sp. NIES-68]|nr:hypothetical protein CLOM_g9699 [Closterium sp. NIES-68]GJP58550.1 hypothetical protein CLOP_g403 [Closterium sp. NIES-67]GJP84730.1 hypothetical protein CLOP_g14789 [Closterium sp. NIES-67]
MSSVAALLLMAVVAFSLSPSEAGVPLPYCRFSGKQVMSNLVTELTKAGNYSTLLAALKTTGLDKDLRTLFNCHAATIFAPTDAAFEELSNDTRTAVDDDSKLLREVVLLHVVQKKMTAAALAALPQGKQLKAAAGGCKARLVKVSARGAQPVEVEAMFGPQRASIVAPDVISLRVVQVHGVDDVILPKSLQKGDKDSLKPIDCFAWRA